MTSAVVAPTVETTGVPDLKGKTAVITGGSKGIGAATVARFVQGGARVVTSGRSQPESLPPGVEYVVADVATAAGVEHLAARAIEVLGEVDIIVNNAGASTAYPGGVLAIPDDEWINDLNINFLAAVRLNAALLPAMYANGRGSIINVASAVTLSPPPPMLHYAAAKSGAHDLHPGPRRRGRSPGRAREHRYPRQRQLPGGRRHPADADRRGRQRSRGRWRVDSSGPQG